MCIPYSSRSPSINSPPASQITFPLRHSSGLAFRAHRPWTCRQRSPATPRRSGRAVVRRHRSRTAAPRSPTTRNFEGRELGAAPVYFPPGSSHGCRAAGRCERRLSTPTGAPPNGRPAPLPSQPAGRGPLRGGRYGPPLPVTDPNGRQRLRPPARLTPPPGRGSAAP